MLSPSDSDGPDGTLSSFDLAGILFPAIPAGIPFPVGSNGPVGSYGTQSPSDSDYVGPCGTLSPSDSDSVGPGGTLSSSDLAGILFSAVPAGIPFPVGPDGLVGPFGMLSPSDSDPVGTLSPSDVEPAGPVGTLPPCNHGTGLSPIVPAGELSSVDPVCGPPGGWFQ